MCKCLCVTEREKKVAFKSSELIPQVGQKITMMMTQANSFKSKMVNKREKKKEDKTG